MFLFSGTSIGIGPGKEKTIIGSDIQHFSANQSQSIFNLIWN